MKVIVDNELVLELNDTEKKVLRDEIPSSILDADLKRRVRYILKHKCEQVTEKMKRKWLPILKERGIKSIPLDDQEFAKLVFEQQDYKDRDAREAEKARLEAGE